MYAVRKSRGSGSVITVVNTDTEASVMIGPPNIVILEILDKEGYGPSKPEPKNIDLRSEWDFEVSEDTMRELTKQALKMRKPVRRTKEKTEQDVTTPSRDKKQPVDVFNLIFGVKDEL